MPALMPELSEKPLNIRRGKPFLIRGKRTFARRGSIGATSPTAVRLGESAHKDLSAIREVFDRELPGQTVSLSEAVRLGLNAYREFLIPLPAGSPKLKREVQKLVANTYAGRPSK